MESDSKIAPNQLTLIGSTAKRTSEADTHTEGGMQSVSTQGISRSHLWKEHTQTNILGQFGETASKKYTHTWTTSSIRLILNTVLIA